MSETAVAHNVPAQQEASPSGAAKLKLDLASMQRLLKLRKVHTGHGPPAAATKRDV